MKLQNKQLIQNGLLFFIPVMILLGSVFWFTSNQFEKELSVLETSKDANFITGRRLATVPDQINQDIQSNDSMVLMMADAPMEVAKGSHAEEMYGSFQENIFTFFLLMTLLVLILSMFFAWLILRPTRLAMDNQKKFIANTSHEIKTPLSLMKSELELFREKYQNTQAPEEEVNYLTENLLQDVNRLTVLITRMISMATSEKVTSRVEQDTFVINDAVFFDTFLKRFSATYPKHILNFLSLKNNEGSVSVSGEDIIQVIEILLENACVHTPEGTHVTLVQNIVDEKFIVHVQDDGPGISITDREHIFDRFYQGENSTGTKGNGLGLSIAKDLVESWGGTLALTNKEGPGTTFTMTLLIK